MGRVSLPVTFDMKENFCTECLGFEVADFMSSYHAIVGRPMLARFMAIPHYTYLELKILAPKVVLTVYCDLLISFKCDNETLKIAMTNAYFCASASMVAEAKKVDPSDLTIPEQKRIKTALDTMPVTEMSASALPTQPR
jgi:hypothetical protein